MYFPLVANRLHIPEIFDAMNYQRINDFLECNNNYNEDEVRMFYAGLKGKFKGCKFKLSMGNKVYTMDRKMWEDMFNIR